MCGIAGILSKKGENVVPLIGPMLSCLRNRGPDGAGIAVNDYIIQSDTLANLNYRQFSANSVLGHLRLAIVGGTCGHQPFRSCNDRLTIEHNGEIYNYKKIRRKLSKHHKFITQTDSEVIVHLLEEHFNENNDLIYAIRKTVAELDGVYSLVIKDEETGTIALVRDKMGVRQIYYGENDRLVAFASERKALWKVGIKEPTRRVLPGQAIVIPASGLSKEYIVANPPIQPTKIRYKTMNSAIREYEKILLAAMKKRTQDFDRIGIIFSGGIDSVIIAWLAKKMVREVICYTGGIKGSSDIIFARQIAKKLKLKLRVNELTNDEVEQMIPDIIHTIEDTNAGQVEVAVPVYAAVKLAHEDGINVMFSGQGADELFGGYSWYTKVVEKEGYQKLREHMTEDLLLLYKETLEREDKITMSHGIEMREPFLDMEIIRLSMQIDPRLNVKGDDDAFGKHVHRQTAQKLGIPRNIAYRIKEAAQHGSGIHDVFDSIARKHGFDESAISKQYLEILLSREKIGSSQRYGYLFENKNERMWIVEPYVQMYLDSISKTLPTIEQNIITKKRIK
ncbi:MAG TPA: asparagine synthase (glutamine-hydrolyzing) [Nitrososphaeraceae archaeon]|jgi:asparagine synthase (glutamine-hydrolysing)|nr:asparagine synthase (glutamine-hydrolyzing) [Nitrososphaeraceae archaeon]